MDEQSDNLISFAEFEIDPAYRRLFRNGEIVSLHAKAFDLLTFLVQNNGRIVTKEEILNAVWESQFVEESNLVVQISNLRKALGETKNSPRFLITIPGKGYKFVAESNEDLLVIETHSVAELTIDQEEISLAKLPKTKNTNLNWITTAGFAVLVLVGIGWFWSGNIQSSPPNKQVKLSKLTTNGKVMNATMSPDGKFAVFAQKEDDGESLWLRQLETGSENRIAAPQLLEYVGLTVSPDNQFIYASIFAKNEIDPKIVKIPIIGGVLQPIPNVTSGASISISPDGKRFAFTDSNNAENETLFGISDIDGSNSRILIRAKHDKRYFEMFKSSPVAWSPDGSEIAVAVNDKEEKGSRSSILMVDPNDGSERYLTEKRWHSVTSPTWIDEDRLAFIASQEEGLAKQVWIISRKIGESKQLTNELQNYIWLAANNGKILAVQVNAFSSLRITDFNENEKTLKPKEVFTASDYIDELDWSKNGDIIYASRASGKSELWQMNNDGSNPKQISSNANVTYGLAVLPSDGSLIFASKQNDKKGIWQTDSNGKNLRQISEGIDQLPDVSNYGEIVFHRGMGYAEGVFLASIGEKRSQMLREKCYFPAISPDGKQTACYFMDWSDQRKWRIALVSTESGELIRKIDLPISIYERQIRWHSSGKYITQIFSVGENLKLILLPIDGGEAKIFDGLGKGISNLPEWSADGKQFLYSLINETQDAVMLTNF